MINRTAILFASLFCLIPLTACFQQEKIIGKLAGVYDNYAYTSPFGL